jgi:probable blue pigment (indigoidine) exporter
MEAKWRWMVITAVAPVAWGATYYVTRQVLPADAPLWASTLRALPAGLVLLALARRRPRGGWWWRSVVLGLLNVGAFFLLVYIAAQLLPTSVASAVMALAPLTLAGSAWLLVGTRPSAAVLVGAVVGIGGVLLLVGFAATPVDPWGVAASAGALLLSSIGAVLTQRWGDPAVPVLAATAWQLLAGGLLLLVIAVAGEGAPPVLGPPELAGFAFVSLVATALAFVCWFGGLAHLQAGAVGLIGLLNPVTGVLLGVVLAGEVLSVAQLSGLGLVLGGLVAGQAGRPAVRGISSRGAPGEPPSTRPAAPRARRACRHRPARGGSRRSDGAVRR